MDQTGRHDNSYKSILKGVSIFGGVQIFQILVNLVRGKFVAMFLGPEGMGVSSLFATSSVTLQRTASLGLNLAIVKEAAESRDSAERLGDVRRVASVLVNFTALLGALVCVAGASWLSRLSFGDDSYRWQFMLLGVAVWLSISGAGKLSMLQGLHEVKRLSRASIVGAIAGLLGGVPLYYFFGNAGIVPAMVVLAGAMWAFYAIQLRRSVEGKAPRFSMSVHKPLVRKLLALGMVLMASDLIGSGCNYALNVFLRGYGSLDAVGLYQAANSLTDQYTGMVFAAMSLDYFPRLSGVVDDNAEMTAVVNRQSEIIALVMTPLVVVFIALAPLVIDILLTGEFRSILELLRWMSLGVLVKAFMFPTGYISFAKNNKTLFFWLEGVLGNLLTLGLGIGGYMLFGLVGMGYALIADTLLCLAIYLTVNGRLYAYRMTGRVVRVYILGFAVASAAVASTFIESWGWSVAALAVLAAGSVAVSATRLVKVMRR